MTGERIEVAGIDKPFREFYYKREQRTGRRQDNYVQACYCMFEC